MSWYTDAWKNGWNTIFGGSGSTLQAPEKPNLIDLSSSYLAMTGGKQDMASYTSYLNQEMGAYNAEVERYNAAVKAGAGNGDILLYVGIAAVVLLLFSD